MTNPEATFAFFDLVNRGVSYEKFKVAAKQYFRTQFKELGCKGISFTRRQWRVEDSGSPFFMLCDQLAVEILDKHEFHPFDVTLEGSANPLQMAPLNNGAYYGLTVRTESCSMLVLLYAGTDKVEVSYTWPQVCTSIENGMVVGESSHTSKDYAFELSHPTSVERITRKVMESCRKMVSSEAA